LDVEQRISVEEMLALKLLANTGRRERNLSFAIQQSLVAKGLIAIQYGNYVLTSRGHAAVLRSEAAKERATQNA